MVIKLNEADEEIMRDITGVPEGEVVKEKPVPFGKTKQQDFLFYLPDKMQIVDQEGKVVFELKGEEYDDREAGYSDELNFLLKASYELDIDEISFALHQERIVEPLLQMRAEQERQAEEEAEDLFADEEDEKEAEDYDAGAPTTESRRRLTKRLKEIHQWRLRQRILSARLDENGEYSILAKGIIDKGDADEIARRREGIVVIDDDDSDKFMVIKREA